MTHPAQSADPQTAGARCAPQSGTGAAGMIRAALMAASATGVTAGRTVVGRGAEMAETGMRGRGPAQRGVTGTPGAAAGATIGAAGIDYVRLFPRFVVIAWMSCWVLILMIM